MVLPSNGDHGSSWVPGTAPSRDPSLGYQSLLLPIAYSILNGLNSPSYDFGQIRAYLSPLSLSPEIQGSATVLCFA